MEGSLYQNPSERLDGYGSEHGRRLSISQSQAKMPIGLTHPTARSHFSKGPEWTKPDSMMDTANEENVVGLTLFGNSRSADLDLPTMS